MPKYGIKHGLTNWAAAYATGLLVARRALTKLGLADKYEGFAEPDGTKQEIEAVEDGPRPFKAFLDVGLKRTSTGSKVFAAMKGASDGGIFIPHSENRFPGYDIESKELDAETLRKYIYGGHVAEYMEYLEEEDDEKYKQQFHSYVDEDVGAEDLEELYKNAHQAIRDDPVHKPTEKDLAKFKAETKKRKVARLTYDERKAAIDKKKAAFEG